MRKRWKKVRKKKTKNERKHNMIETMREKWEKNVKK